MQNFNLKTVKTLNPMDAKNYITKYFVPLSDGNHAMFQDGKYTIKEDPEIKKSYFNRMSKELNNYYFKEYDEIKTIVHCLNKPTFFDDKINLCPQMKFKYNPDYKPSSDTKKKLDFFLQYMNEVLCSSRKDCYDFLLKWTSNMLKGNKNNSCLYLKGIQGIGKSTYFEMISRYVIGDALSLETGSDPIRTKFNEILGGKLLVSIEELENFSKAEWESISSTLKRMITSSRINLQNKGTKAYESNNINNYILCSNNDAIKDDEGRRYFILDISTHRYEDEAYFKKLYDECFSDAVGEAFFNYVYSIDTTGFNPQKYPLTNSKLDSIVKRLDSVYKFIKDHFILHNEGLNIKCSDLFELYRSSSDGVKKTYGREDFHKKMAEAGIIKIKRSNWMYIISAKDLLAIATKRHWIHELDEFVNEEIPNQVDQTDDDLEKELEKLLN